jgi:diaminopimelate decarboxylase
VPFFVRRFTGHCRQYGLKVERIHTTLDPDLIRSFGNKWRRSLSRYLSFGHGVELGRWLQGRPRWGANNGLTEIGKPVKPSRSLPPRRPWITVEIGPGTYLAMAGAMVRVPNQDRSSTGESGHTYLKLDAGMTDVLRPSLAAEPSTPLPLPSSGKSADVGEDSEDTVVVGHCCESGDLDTQTGRNRKV